MNKQKMDLFCWKCHVLGVNVHCKCCQRSFHEQCVKENISQNWICNECVNIFDAVFDKERVSTVANLPSNYRSALLNCVVKKMMAIKNCHPFLNMVDEYEGLHFNKYIVHPMDLTCLQRNVQNLIYGNTAAFLADAKWIVHNSFIINSNGSNLILMAKKIIKVCNQEVQKIETCHNCYYNSEITQTECFVEVCPIPHSIVWAKSKGYPYWPAKVMRANSSGMIDVRYFGSHDRAWVPAQKCFLISRSSPKFIKRSRIDLDESIKECQLYMKNLVKVFGAFHFAPYRTQFNPEMQFEYRKQMIRGYIEVTANTNISGINKAASKLPKPENNLKRRSSSNVELPRKIMKCNNHHRLTVDAPDVTVKFDASIKIQDAKEDNSFVSVENVSELSPKRKVIDRNTNTVLGTLLSMHKLTRKTTMIVTEVTKNEIIILLENKDDENLRIHLNFGPKCIYSDYKLFTVHSNGTQIPLQPITTSSTTTPDVTSNLCTEYINNKNTKKVQSLSTKSIHKEPLLTQIARKSFQMPKNVLPKGDSSKSTVVKHPLPPLLNYSTITNSKSKIETITQPSAATKAVNNSIASQFNEKLNQPGPSTASQLNEELIQPGPSTTSQLNEKLNQPGCSTASQFSEEFNQPDPSTVSQCNAESNQPDPSTASQFNEKLSQPGCSTASQFNEELIQPGPSTAFQFNEKLNQPGCSTASQFNEELIQPGPSTASQFNEKLNRTGYSTASQFNKELIQPGPSTASQFNEKLNQPGCSTASQFNEELNQPDPSTVSQFNEQLNQPEPSTASQFNEELNEPEPSTAFRGFEKLPPLPPEIAALWGLAICSESEMSMSITRNVKSPSLLLDYDEDSSQMTIVSISSED